MEKRTANVGMLSKLMFRLLPIQILLAAVGAVNGLASCLFALAAVVRPLFNRYLLGQAIGAFPLMLGASCRPFSPWRTREG